MNLSNYKKEIKNIEYSASRIYGRLSSFTKNHIERQDLVQAGYLGLMDAIEKSEANEREMSISYAQIRIHGSMIDAVRTFTPLSKHISKHKDSNQIRIIDVDDHEDELGDTLIDTDMIDLENILDGMTPGREKRILDYYLLGISQKDIGIMEGVSESRISQIMMAIIEQVKLEYLI